MSSEYFFKKWKRVLTTLEEIVTIDLDYQETKVHSKDLCSTVQRLSAMLAGYIAVYNDALDCLHHSLQVQKTQYIAEVVSAVTLRMVELKRQLSKLENNQYQFITRGLADMKLTTDHVELNEIPIKAVRPPEIQNAINDLWKDAEEAIEQAKREKELEEAKNEEPEIEKKWYEIEEEKVSEAIEENIEKLTEEQLTRRKKINLIAAQEKCRQVIKERKHAKIKKEMWEIQLLGLDKPQARLELKNKAAAMIQRMMRAYFQAKRNKIKECKLDEKLGIRVCKKFNDEERTKSKETDQKCKELKSKYEAEQKKFCEDMKSKCVKYKLGEVKENCRDEIRTWFRKWYDEAWYFYDIPKEDRGGSTLIVLEETPEPREWLEENQIYNERLKSSKGNNNSQKKREKAAAKKEAQLIKKQEQMAAKQEEILLKKMMKNPNMHPGFTFPQSKATEQVLDAIKKYHRNWDYLDSNEPEKVKERFVKAIDEDHVWAEIKREMRILVDDDMRNELKILKTALKQDYADYEEEYPNAMPQTHPKLPKKPKVKSTMNKNVAKRILDLAIKGIVKEYPPTKFADFKGEPNFAGDDVRCNFVYAVPYGGETRNIWWDKCRELIQGFRKVMLVGSRASGKTILVHAMASVNDAMLFELDPLILSEKSDTDLPELVNSVAICAKAFQPSVIYIKHIHRLFYRKKPPEEPEFDVQLIRKLLSKKLDKKFGKGDKVTIIATCVDPWLTRSSQLLKQFPTIVLMPNTTYTTTVNILWEWVLNNRAVPPDLNISSLAQVIQGYSFGYLKKCLDSFLTAERIVRMAVHGLSPLEVYDYILEDQKETKVEYDKYLTWYAEKTHQGMMEKKHLTAQLEFQALAKKYAQKKKKTLKSAASSVASL